MCSTARHAFRIAMLAALLAACAAEPQKTVSSGGPTPSTLTMTVTGDTHAVLAEDGTGQIILTRDGASEPMTVAFTNSTPATADLAPGAYSITGLGPLICRGMTFEVDPAAGARALGSLDARVVTTDYYVALMSRRAASGAEIADLADRANADPAEVDSRPVAITETAPCYMGTGGPQTTWHDLPLEEKILLGIGFAGFCAVALAAGGICAF